MTLSIDISREMEGRLRQRARQLGVEPAEYAKRLIHEQLAVRKLQVADVDFDQALDEFFLANPEQLPALPLDFGREDIYSDHD